MSILPSGLAEIVADEEDLVHYLLSYGQFSATKVKPNALLPNPKDNERSVFRHGSEPRDQLWKIGLEHVVGERKLYGAAVFKAKHVRAVMLDVVAAEPPPRHAAVVGWPRSDDPELQKAQQKERAALIAQHAQLILRQ